MVVAGEAGPSRPKADGPRLASLEEGTRIADLRLKRLEAASAQMKGDLELLAEAAGGLRQQSQKMREAALRVAEVVQVAARRKKAARKGGGGKARQGEGRPPRT